MINKVDNAIILAAGFGSRFVPITYDTPKALIKVFDKPMIEQQIEFLLAKDIKEIVVVVGYLKEKFDYLKDKYGVKLIFNSEYSTKNNLASLYHAANYLKNSYIISADVWLEHNMFNSHEQNSWISCKYFEGETAEWGVKTDDTGLIKSIDLSSHNCPALVGPAFFTKELSMVYLSYLKSYYEDECLANYYWEHILKEKIDKLPIYINDQSDNVFEFESLEELRVYDKSYQTDTDNWVIEFIVKKLNVKVGDICDIYPIKEGITNNSFHFRVAESEYILRVPGIGTDKQINRGDEKLVYDTIGKYKLTDEVVMFDASSGVKISKFINDIRVANPFNDRDLELSMQHLKKIHDLQLTVPHRFDIENKIKGYQTLVEESNFIRFSDIEESKKKLAELCKLKDELNIPEILCHGDFLHNNVLILPDNSVVIVDFEFSAMADPIMDVVMYDIFALFDFERIDLSVDMYLGRKATKQERIRGYIYVSLGGFLWTMWSEYKQSQGQEFGDYPNQMYNYFKSGYDQVKKLCDGKI